MANKQKKKVGNDIKSIYGQPFYHSVDLSWEVEDKYINNRINNDEHGQLNEPISFIINYCEIQGFDLQKCNTKVMVDNDDIDNEKFLAEATKCLPNESEIEIQTGPNFSGKIVSENSKCEIQGNPNDDSETYVMRIDHEKCGSRVSNDDLTVETYITVQENTGILTHSTRKFLVVCTFQPDTLTVRAKLALPSKNGEVIPDDEEQQMWSPDRERSSRNRQFKMVDKSALILKESNEHSIENAIGDIEI
ncbi:hypothetical protein PVAND_005482 [Polypedilum vanderplanki]|uniref:ZP domain-containing protein n=1 Tax=Polypedilum vanderplanki TaxID=319348 RepID=A0A9J6C167_POLVA|nr:hypothetical protein PVAND_005482 [Polypedilum vanderplanki]